jgi:hypothetical protein
MVKYVIVTVPTIRETRANISGEGNLHPQNKTSVQRIRKKRKPFRNNKPWLRRNGRPIH